MVNAPVVVGICQVTRRRNVRTAPGLPDGLAPLSLIFLNNLFPASPGGRDFVGISISPDVPNMRPEASPEYSASIAGWFAMCNRGRIHPTAR